MKTEKPPIKKCIACDRSVLLRRMLKHDVCRDCIAATIRHPQGFNMFIAVIRKKAAIIILSFLFATGCATTRTKWNDKNMRIMVDPDSVSIDHVTRIQGALVRQKMWTIVDRGKGFKAVKKEQERLHVNRKRELANKGIKSSERFEDREKWAQWGRMYGVGAIVVAHAQCRAERHWLFKHRWYWDCQQFLKLIDANTGEVIVAVQGENDGPSSQGGMVPVPDWEDITEKLAAAYPKTFHDREYDERLKKYQDDSERRARAQRIARAK